MLDLNLKAGTLGVMLHDVPCDDGYVHRYLTFTNIPFDDSLHGCTPGRTETTTKYPLQGLFANTWFSGTLVPKRIR